MKYAVTLVKSDEGWAVWCDAFPGRCSQGISRAEALANIRDAITEYLAAQSKLPNATDDHATVHHAEVCI